MRYRIQNTSTSLSFWNPRRIIISTVMMILLIVCGSCTIKVLSSLFFKPVSVFPTSIPWIHSEAECKHTNRTWQDDECWDYEHDMTF